MRRNLKRTFPSTNLQGRQDVFSPDVMSVLEAGTSLIVGTVGEDGEPRATRAFALVVVDDAPTVRVLISADDPVVVEHLRTGRVAITAADVRTLHSVSLPGHWAAVMHSTQTPSLHSSPPQSVFA